MGVKIGFRPIEKDEFMPIKTPKEGWRTSFIMENLNQQEQAALQKLIEEIREKTEGQKVEELIKFFEERRESFQKRRVRTKYLPYVILQLMEQGKL